MEQGRVKWYSVAKEYGFIVRERGADVFVHHAAIADGGILHQRELVAFEVVEGPKGLQAKNVVRIAENAE